MDEKKWWEFVAAANVANKAFIYFFSVVVRPYLFLRDEAIFYFRWNKISTSFKRRNLYLNLLVKRTRNAVINNTRTRAQVFGLNVNLSRYWINNTIYVIVVVSDWVAKTHRGTRRLCGIRNPKLCLLLPLAVYWYLTSQLIVRDLYSGFNLRRWFILYNIHITNYYNAAHCTSRTEE